MDKKTPLYEAHLSANAKMVSFASYLMPIQYEQGILSEHHAVRNQAGLFDVSHMGEFLLSGNDALSNLNYLITNDFTDLAIGKARYGILCDDDGFAIDDLIVYHTKEKEYLLVVNASNCEKDFKWMSEKITGEVVFENISDRIGQIALQGPNSEIILKEITSDIPTAYYSFIETTINNQSCIISRTGYTGEDGFELYTNPETTVYLWNKLMEVGEKHQLQLCGLGCRDTLRLEAGMPLYGHELSDSITPLEAGLKIFVKLEKDFIGKDALQTPACRKKVGLVLSERGIAREGQDIYQDEKKVGVVTSGTFSPTLNQAIALALVDVNVDIERAFEIDVRGKRIKAERVKLPFYRKKDTK